VGYKRARKAILLRFEDEPELEVLARSVSVSKFLGVMAWADQMQAGKLDEKAVTQLCEWLAERIISWNLEDDDGRPVPVSAEYLLEEDFDWTVRLFMAWVGSISKVMQFPSLQTAPEGVSPPGDPLEASIPMSPATPG
jgi:hypothetical protein